MLGLQSFNNAKSVKPIYIVAISVIVLVAGFKTQGSTDFFSYKGVYDYSNTTLNLESSYELGFQLFNIICKQLGFSFVIYYFLFTCINIGIKAYVINKIVPYVFPALLMYLCGVFFERDNDGIRQGMSISFCFLSMYYLIQKQRKAFLVSYLVAVLFHYTSFVFVIVYLFDKIKIKDKYVAITVMTFFVLCALHLSFSNLLINYLPSAIVHSKIEKYTDSDGYSVSMGISIGILFRLFILMLFMKMRQKMTISEQFYLILRNGFAASLIMSLAFNDFVILAHRLPYVFREFQIFIVPYLFTAIKNNSQKTVFYILTWIYCCILLYRFLNGDAADVYKSYENYLFSF